MQLSINRKDTFVATGGREFDKSQPTIVLLHGAGFDHTIWALHSRWFAHHGFGVLAPDLPGHGRSSGAPLPTIADMADWTADLLKAAEANDRSAIDMVSIWGLGFQAELGGSLAPGLWMHSGAQRVLEQCRPGVLFNDLAACNAYQNALAAAAQVTVPATFILGERDMMTPARAGKTLAAAMPNSRTVVLRGAGHMMMVERPDELLAALQG